MAGQAGADPTAMVGSTAKSIALPEGAINFNMGTLVGSYASVARMLDSPFAARAAKGHAVIAPGRRSIDSCRLVRSPPPNSGEAASSYLRPSCALRLKARRHGQPSKERVGSSLPVSIARRASRTASAPDRGSQVRTRFAGGGKWIRTLGPPASRTTVSRHHVRRAKAPCCNAATDEKFDPGTSLP